MYGDVGVGFCVYVDGGGEFVVGLFVELCWLGVV